MKKKNQWLLEYQDFLNDDAPAVPTGVKEDVYTHIHSLLQPKAFDVFLKILVIHLTVGFLSLSVCHQFDINPFNTQRSLADIMMSLGGHNFCMLGCGVLFVSLSVLAAGLFLTIEEVSALKRTEILQTLSLALFSLGLFAAIGAELTVGVAGLWLIGGFIGGFASAETVWRLKQI